MLEFEVSHEPCTRPVRLSMQGMYPLNINHYNIFLLQNIVQKYNFWILRKNHQEILRKYIMAYGLPRRFSAANFRQTDFRSAAW